MIQPALRGRSLAGMAALILSLFCSVAAAADVTAGRQKVEGFLQSLQSLQAQFKQTLSDRSGAIIEEASGELAIRRPDRFRWDYRQPNQQVIVADGARIWLYESTPSPTSASIRLNVSDSRPISSLP